MHNFLSDALLNLFSAATPARPLNQLFNPLTFAIAIVSGNLVAVLVAGDGAREVPSCQQQAGVGAGTSGSAKAKAKPGMTTVSVRWQLLLTLGIACSAATGGSRLLLVDLTSPMESGALAFRQGRALSAHYRRC